VPVKAPGEAKSRLAPALDEQARAALVRAMLGDVLTAVREAHDGPLAIVSPDRDYDGIASRFGAVRLPDEGAGYNAALGGALAHRGVQEAGVALILPADQPRAQPAELRAALEALRSADVVLVPALDGGTALLGLRPPQAIAPAFGPASADAHRAAAREHGRTLAEVHAPSLWRDVDTVADLVSDRARLGRETAAFVAAHAVELAAAIGEGQAT
jgi:2-phospho-L-lactate guanylyltransferase